MKKNKNKSTSKNKRILPLLASVALISGPVLAVVACNSEITRYSGALPNDLQNRILFSFVGVNYNVNAKSQFSAAYKQEMDFIRKEVEGIIAQQKFNNIFVKKLDYTEEQAKEAFTKIRDNLGLNILAADYFNTINNEQNFDNKVYKSKLIFQTENWHQPGTIKFDYNNPESWYSKTDGPNPEDSHNPDQVFTPGYLYDPESLYGDTGFKRDKQIQEIAKYADENFQKELPILTQSKAKWTNPVPEIQLPPSLVSADTNAIQDYQKKLERFKWWLRFRYQQYYQATILPQLNETLFTMANIFDSILNITRDSSGKPEVLIDSTKYAIQLQGWGTNSTWKSNYRWVWDYTTSLSHAQDVNKNWASNPLPELVTLDGNSNPILNSAFFTSLAGTDTSLKNTVDPALGINGYINDTNGKVYDSTIKSDKNIRYYISNWAENPDGTGAHYWGQNTKGTFAYSAPVYWIDVIQNLNFNYYNDPSKVIVIDKDKNLNKKWITTWNNLNNGDISNSPFSKYIRADNMPTDTNSPEYKNLQEMKWNIFWQMIYFLSSQEDTNSNKDVAKDNFNIAAKDLFPEFIKKENIYNDEFWQTIKAYY